jgi:ribosomal protein S18 acetylase RimI-like enzyme
MEIREFDLKLDYPSVRELWQQAGPGVQLSPSDEPPEIERKLERDPDLFLVLEEQGDIIGTVIGGYDGRRGIVYHLAIQPERRGEGLGRTQVLTFYQSIGCELMDLHVLGKVLR